MDLPEQCGNVAHKYSSHQISLKSTGNSKFQASQKETAKEGHGVADMKKTHKKDFQKRDKLIAKYFLSDYLFGRMDL